MNRVYLLIICLIVLLTSMCFPAYAESEGLSCGKAVIVYLDVSGSMNEVRNNAYSIKTGESITLTQAMGELFEILFDEETGVVKPEDYFEFKGFYSKVSPLVPRSSYFKNIQKKVFKTAMDMQNGGLSSSLVKKCVSPLGWKTSFAEVLRDIDITSQRLMNCDGAYRQILYIIFTDGLDDSGNPEDLSAAFINNSLCEYNTRQQSKTKLLMFGLPYEHEPKENEINVQPAFEQELDGVFFPCDEELDTRMVIKTIREQTLPSIEVVKIGTPEPSSNLEEIHIPITFANDSCSDLTLKSFVWSIVSSDKRRSNIESPSEFVIGSKSSGDSLKKYDLIVPKIVLEGNVTISVSPETFRGGHGLTRKEVHNVFPYIMLRNTTFKPSVEQNRLICKTMLVNRFSRDLFLDSLHVDLLRYPPGSSKAETLLTNHIIPYSEKSIVLSGNAKGIRYRDIYFDLKLPEILPGKYVIKVYAKEGQGGDGNTVQSSTYIEPSVFIERIEGTRQKDGSFKLNLSIGNRTEKTFKVESVTVSEAVESGVANEGWDWARVETKTFRLKEPLTLQAGEFGQTSVFINTDSFSSKPESRLLVMATSQSGGVESAAKIYELPVEKSSVGLQMMMLLLVVVAGFVAFKFII